MQSVLLVLFALGVSVTSGQRVAPGVPPQHYQQPPQQYQQQPMQHQQQYQQHPQQNLPPAHQQQMPQQQQQQQQMQYQQVPIQQQAPVQQVPVQQVPQGHGHHAPHAHHGQQPVLSAANIQHEREHIKEHMPVPIDTSKMSEAELQFHYFKMHDSDNNNKLDGCELIKSLIHWHVEHEEAENTAKKEEKIGDTYTDDKLLQIIDHVLLGLDLNNDGYIDYAEYRKSEEASNNNKL